MRYLLTIGFTLSLGPCLAAATTPDALINRYRQEAQRTEPELKAFSPEAGKRLYFTERDKGGEKISCASCHTSDARSSGKSRAGKVIEPLAPTANPARFTDEAKVEKWFRRNCADVLDRPCTAKEKGEFLSYLLSIR
jgi:cytochrome c peroxidase